MKLSADGYEGLASYCKAQGISMTAYIDALGQWFLDYQNGTEGASPAAGRALMRVVEHARIIDTERRARG